MYVLDQRSPAELAQRADENMLAHVSWVQSRAPGMRAEVSPDLVLVDCGMRCDTFNIVCRARLDSASAAQRIGDALAYYTRAGHPFAWWHSPADQPTDLPARLEAAGLERAETELAMAADLHALDGGDFAPGGLVVRRARTAQELADFAVVVSENWTPPDGNVLRFYEQAAPFVLDGASPLWMYVGYVDGVPVAASQLAEGGGVVGLYNVCTLEAFRRRGYAAALTLQPLLDARDRGYATGVLQASSGGAGVYARIGFRIYGQISEYKPGPQSA